MANTLGDATTSATRPADTRPTRVDGAGAVPAARRGGRSGWRDPRLWIGVVIVAASVLVGARVLGSADDTVQVWAAASDLGAGTTLGADDLVAERVHFADVAASSAYFRTDQTLPADVQLSRSVGAGELLARSAVGSATSTGLLEVPIAVDPEQVPASVGEGAVVDVYVVAPASDAGTAASGAAPAPGGAGRAAGPALSAVTVVDAPSLTSSFGATGKRQLVLAVRDADARAFFALLAGYDNPVLTVVRRG